MAMVLHVTLPVQSMSAHAHHSRTPEVGSVTSVWMAPIGTPPKVITQQMCVNHVTATWTEPRADLLSVKM